MLYHGLLLSVWVCTLCVVSFGFPLHEHIKLYSGTNLILPIEAHSTNVHTVINFSEQ